jgi:hypothetical protein
MATTQPFASILILLTFALMIGIWMYGMYDSYKTADRINRKKESFYRKSIFFWLSVALFVIIIAAVIAAFVFPVSNTTNIQTSSEIPSSNDQITDKNLAVRSYGDFLQEGQTNTYYFDVNNENAGGKLLKIIAQGQPGTKITSAVGINYVPSIENRKFDFISEANSDSVIDINNPQPGRYFVTVKGVKGSGDTRVSRSFY